MLFILLKHKTNYLYIYMMNAHEVLLSGLNEAEIHSTLYFYVYVSILAGIGPLLGCISPDEY